MSGTLGRMFYRPEEVAAILKCSLSTVYRRLRDGTIPSLTIRGIVRIPVKKFHEQFDDASGSSRQETSPHR